MKKIVVLLIFLFVACSEDDPIIQYSISVQVTPVEGGSVSPSSGMFNEGESISLLATPSAEYIFKKWSGEESGTSNPKTVVMKSNVSITAVFEKKDTDSDGVADDVDICPNTPIGETVDNKGCSISQMYTYIPDDNFEQALIDWGFDNIMDDYVLTSNIEDMKSISLYNLEISDLTGIENFVALNKLICHHNQLTNLNVSQNTSLTYLDCSFNELIGLDVSKNIALTELRCHGNQLNSLDVSKNTSLTYLDCGYNGLTSLDVSKNTALTNLSCGYNELTILDVSQNTTLTHLYCFVNSLSSLDVSQNTALVFLFCNFNELTNLDVRHNTALTYLQCSNNKLISLDVSQNIALADLNCGLNNNLFCIQINSTQLSSIPSNWVKDDTANYALTCN